MLINTGKKVDEPVLKVLGYKVVPGGSGGQNRYRLLLSDGVKTHSYVEVLGVEPDTAANRPPFRTVTDNSTVSTKPATVTTTLTPTIAKPDSNVMKTPPKSSAGPFSGGLLPSTPGTPNSGMPKVFPIQSLNPYQNRWTVRARVSQKAAIRTWNKQGRDGKLFSFTIVDESGEIRVTAFNAEVDKFFDIIEVNKAYYLTRAHLKAANKQFNTTNNEYEMTLHTDTQIVPCEDEDTSALPETHFNFISIGKLDQADQGSFVDVAGIVHETGEVQTIMAKASQRELRKRELGLVDSSKCLVRLTLWGDEAANFDGSQHPAIVVKGAKVSDFNGRSLSVSTSSSVMINPTNVSEAIRLKGWYEHEGRLDTFETYKSEMMGSAGGSGDGAGGTSGGGCLGGWNLIQDLKASGVGTNAKPDYFSCKSTAVFMKKDNFMYQACPADACNKKVVDLGSGMYRCEKCARETPNYKWRLLLTVKIADITGDLWVTCFQDSAEQLLGQTAESLGAMKESQDETQLERVFMQAVFNSWFFRLRAKVDRYNDEERLRVVVADVKPLKHVDYARRLAKAITELAPKLPSEMTEFTA